MFFNKSANPFRKLIRGIISVAIGITIIIVPGLSINLVIQALGVLLILDGLINLIISLSHKSKQQNVLVLIPRGIPSLITGSIFILLPSLLVGFFVFLVGFVLIMIGGSQLVVQGGRKGGGFSLINTLLSIIALVAGLFMLSNPFKGAVSILIFLGAVVVLYGIGEVIVSFKIRKYQKQNPPEQPDIVDAEYEEVE